MKGPGVADVFAAAVYTAGGLPERNAGGRDPDFLLRTVRRDGILRVSALFYYDGAEFYDILRSVRPKIGLEGL